MAERAGPQVYSIAAHRGFADALVAGLIPRYAQDDVGLARLTLLLPSRRAERIVTEAFIRLSGGGMLLPRMAVVGDLDLDETLGPLLDPLGAGGAQSGDELDLLVGLQQDLFVLQSVPGAHLDDLDLAAHGRGSWAAGGGGRGAAFS